MNTEIREIANNKKAYFEYFIEEKYEAGIALTGTEVKSIRAGKINIRDAYAFIEDGEIYLEHAHISPYEQGNIFNVDPLRRRKLLMHKKEIHKLYSKVKEKGYSIAVLRVYFKGSNIKVEIGLAKGKKLHDKRDDIAKKDAKRQMDRVMKDRNHY